MSVKNIFFSILTVALFSSFAFAQGGGQPNQPNQPRREGMGRGMIERRMGDGGGMMRMRMPGMMDFSRLNLTDAQKQRIQTILENNQKTAQTNQTQFQEMGKLMMLKRQGLLTTEQGTRLTSLEAQMTTNRDRFRNDILAVLTPEQKTLFDQMQNEGGRMRGRGEGGMMRRGGRGDGRPEAPKRPGAPIGGNTPQSPPSL